MNNDLFAFVRFKTIRNYLKQKRSKNRHIQKLPLRLDVIFHLSGQNLRVQNRNIICLRHIQCLG